MCIQDFTDDNRTFVLDHENKCFTCHKYVAEHRSRFSDSYRSTSGLKRRRESDEPVDVLREDDSEDIIANPPKALFWNNELDAKLLAALERVKGEGKLKGQYWKKVSEYMGGERDHRQCQRRWSKVLRYLKDSTKGGKWTEEEDNALLEAISRCPLKEDGSIQWVAVSCELGGSRTYEQCCNRYRHHLKYREWPVNNGQWADNEDHKLYEAIALHTTVKHRQGRSVRTVDWEKVAEHMGCTRRPEQCYNRWHRHLKYADKVREDRGWDDNEDRKLYEAVNLYMGADKERQISWTRVSDHLGGYTTGRSADRCRARWNTIKKRLTPTEELV